MPKFSFSKKYNKERLFPISTEGFEYYSLENLIEEFGYEQVYIVKGLYINTKSQYGAAPVAALDDRYVNLPSHLTGTVEEMLDDPAAIAAINNGAVGFSIYDYPAHGKTCYGVTWVDIDP